MFKKEDIVFEYTDAEAIEDGIIHPFTVNGKRIPCHRITNNALNAIMKRHNKTKEETLEFVFSELLPLLSQAVKAWKTGKILTTDYTFKVGKFKHSEVLWFIPNENGGITVMLPEDY